MSYVDDLVGRKPEITPFSQYITNNLADNYVKGLGEKSKYRNRLSRGIEVATQTAAEDLPVIIQGLISDRMAKSADTRITSGEIATLSEGQQRVLILALWSSRIPKINRDGKIDIENTRVYGNENSMPPAVLLRRPIPTPDFVDEAHEPTLAEVLKSIIPKGRLK